MKKVVGIFLNRSCTESMNGLIPMLYADYSDAEDALRHDIYNLCKVRPWEKIVSNPKFPALSENVTELKETEGGVSAMCQIMQHYEEKARQQGIQQGMKQGMQQGRKQGMQQGQDETLSLMQRLFAAGRVEDAKRITTDKSFLNQVKKEFAM